MDGRLVSFWEGLVSGRVFQDEFFVSPFEMGIPESVFQSIRISVEIVDNEGAAPISRTSWLIRFDYYQT